MTSSKKIFSGGFLTVSMRWSDRLIGLVSMIVLARLLVPADFGLVAMATLFVGFVDVVMDLGVTQVLIHNDDVDNEEYNTAWTVRFIQSCIAFGTVFVFAPFAAEYFRTPELTDVLRVMSLALLVSGFENIGVVNFQKEMNFGKDFKFFFCKRVIAFVATLSIALIYQSYWAMVLGTLFGRMGGVVLSYVMHSYRPRFCLTRLKRVWSFSQWVLFKNIGAYFDSSMDRLIVGRYLDTNTLGGYTVAREISSMPTTELLAPLGRVLFPAFVEKRSSPQEFSARVTLAIAVQSLLAVPACIGLVLVADDAVLLFLGKKWMFTVPLIQIMAVTNLVLALAHAGGYALLALGKVKVQAMIVWLQAVIFVLAVFFSGKSSSAESIALVRLFSVTVGSAAMLLILFIQLRTVSIASYLLSILRPSIAAAVMFFAVDTLNEFICFVNPVARLSIDVTVGGIVYVVALMSLWNFMGRPVGAETYLLGNFLEYKNRYSTR